MSTEARITALVEALEEIAFMGTDMPAAYNDEASWYRGRAYNAIGTAARALRAWRLAEQQKPNSEFAIFADDGDVVPPEEILSLLDAAIGSIPVEALPWNPACKMSYSVGELRTLQAALRHFVASTASVAPASVPTEQPSPTPPLQQGESNG